jgi:hypothetical protein
VIVKNTTLKSPPYLTIIVTGRNDNYGGDWYFKKKHNSFIEYYSKYLDKENNFLEIILVDYNKVQDKPSYFDQFNWEKFKLVKKVSVSNSEHRILSGESKYPFFGNIAFNEGLRIASGEYVLGLSVDTYLSKAMLNYLKKKQLDKNFFYRSDLYYFRQNYFKNKLMQRLWNRFTLIKVSLRHSSTVDSNLDKYIDALIGKVIKIPKSFRNVNEKEFRNYFETIEFPDFPINGNLVNKWLIESGLHTNASGDFILASRKAWIKINGFSEDHNWNLHNDSMVLGEFCKIGLKQRLFKWPLVSYHALHDRGGWSGMKQLEWIDWCNLFCRVLQNEFLLAKRPFKVD